MSTEIPPPPAPTPSAGPTQITGQQTAPSTSVPMGTPGMPAPGSIARPGQNNTLALVSFITALAAPFGHLVGVGGITLIIVSIVTGHMARAQIRRTGEAGGGFALAGLIISYVHLAISVLVFIFFFGLIFAVIAGFFGPH
ncbi:MAG TPA: DUF4190 domain-containing protein [Candidatus Nitrosopolaris sp.]|nr:DUF4190 domain-containing protein [Candidatus Nitrosopolaris sp.]